MHLAPPTKARWPEVAVAQRLARRTRCASAPCRDADACANLPLRTSIGTPCLRTPPSWGRRRLRRSGSGVRRENHPRPPIDKSRTCLQIALDFAKADIHLKSQVSPDITMDVAGDIDSNGTWLTYGEIAAARGIKRSGAIRLAQRHRWRKQAGNDGLARVLVPPEMAKPGDRARDVPGTVTATVSGDVVSDVAASAAAFGAALDALREQQQAERAGWTEERMRLTVVIDGFEKETAAQRDMIAALQAKVTELEAGDVRRIASRWARIRAAWRGG